MAAVGAASPLHLSLIYVGDFKMVLRALLTALMTASFAVAAQAASVASIEGQGSVNRGGGFQPLQVGAQLEPGNRVLAAPGSSVTITFGPNCAIHGARGTKLPSS